MILQMLIKNYKICKLHHLVRQSSIKYQNIFKFSTNRFSYPFKFGGIQINIENMSHANYINFFLPINTMQGFRESYVAILDGLMRKDKQFLAANMASHLMQNLVFQEVKLINRQKPIQIEHCKVFVVINGVVERTERNNKIYQHFLMNPNSPGLFFSYDLKKKNGYSKQDSNSTPLLICCQIYYKSECKLIKQQQQQNNQQQIHMLQFEAQCLIKMNKSIDRYIQFLKQINIISQNQKIHVQDLSKFVQQLIGDYQWKITDFDLMFNGNFNKVISKKGFIHKAIVALIKLIMKFKR